MVAPPAPAVKMQRCYNAALRLAGRLCGPLRYMLAPMRRDWTRTTYGERVRYITELRGLSLNQLAALSGLSSGTVSRLARRETPMPDFTHTLRALCETGRVPVAWLAFGQGEPEDTEAARLSNRVEWAAARVEALATHGELAAEDVDAVGGLRDSSAIPPLDGAFVAGVASELAALRKRTTPRPDRPKVLPLRRT